MTGAIALVGASGAGKSTIGRLLADKLGRSFVDVDGEIVRAGGRSITEIFDQDGESHFRVLERDATLRALQSDAVVALGGGAPMTLAIADALRSIPHVVWLQVSAAEAAQRVGGDPRRPLLSQGDALSTLTAMQRERDPVYAEVSKFSVSTEGRRRTAVVDDIVHFISREGS